MKTGTKIFIAIGSIAVLIFFIAFASIWSDKGEIVSLKNQIEGKYLANQSDYDKMWKSFKEMAQVTTMQEEQIKSIYTAIMEGRYEGDEKVAVKAIVEDNPNIDSSIYNDLMLEISSNRNVFNNNQKQLLDMINTYNTFVEHDGVIAASIFGFERIDPSKYIVTSEKTDNAFKTGKDDEINLIGK